jgi:uncharacterized peroxidase-related enzyme
VSYLDTVSEGEAVGEVADLYESERGRVGYLPNYVRVFSSRPGVYRAWRDLVQSVMSGADFRRFELATLAAARRLRSSYCALAHGSVLAEKFYDAGAVGALPAGLDEADAAVMAFADKVAADAASVTRDDLQRLGALGLTDEEIVDVVLAVAARKFFSTVLDALGAEPDSVYNELDPALREALTVGRPIAQP